MTDPEGEVGVIKLSYVDPENRNKPVTVDQAAKDYSRFRAERALEVLKSIDQAQKAEAEAALAAQQPPQASPEEEAAQRQAEEQARAQAEFEQQRAQELESVRQQANGYAIALNALVANANNRALAEFADIRTEADLIKLAQTDQPRLQRLQAHFAQVQAVQQEISRVQQQQAAQQRAAWAEIFQRYAAEQAPGYPGRIGAGMTCA
jgi:hypothetical protein